jgi:hypothetical protein
MPRGVVVSRRGWGEANGVSAGAGASEGTDADTTGGLVTMGQ